MRDTIGEVAGYVWEYLDNEGEASVTAVTKAVDVPATKVYMAIGWLTKEGKLGFREAKRGTKLYVEE